MTRARNAIEPGVGAASAAPSALLSIQIAEKGHSTAAVPEQIVRILL